MIEVDIKLGYNIYEVNEKKKTYSPGTWSMEV